MSTTYPTLDELKRSLDQLQAAFCLPCPIEHITMFERVLSLGGPATYSERIAQTELAEVAMEDVYAALGWLHTCEPAAYQHFLPRIFTIMVEGPYWFWEADDIGAQLKRLEWQAWPTFQRDAITLFVERWIRWTLQEPEVTLDTLSESLALGRVLFPERAWLPELLRDDPQRRFLRKLVSWLEGVDVPEANYRWSSALMREVRRPAVGALLEAAFFAEADAAEAERISEAVDRMDWYLR